MIFGRPEILGKSVVWDFSEKHIGVFAFSVNGGGVWEELEKNISSFFLRGFAINVVWGPFRGLGFESGTPKIP